MDKEEHQKFLASIRETQEKSRRTLERITSTLSGVNQTLTDIKQTNENIDKIKTEFNTLMDKLSLSIATSFSSPLKKVEGRQYDKLPKKIEMKEAVKEMLEYDKILFITGAGVSVESGIPTFRGQNGLYTKKFQFEEKELDPETFITKLFFSQHPQAIWEWIEQIYQMSTKSKSNKVHQLIHECALTLAKLKKKVTLVTQNIDDLHIKPENKEYDYYPVHGNVKLMRCSDNHMVNYQKDQCMGECKKCGQKLRPHVMFFDESYGVPFGGEVKDEEFPFVIVIGTSLNTGLCLKLAASGKKVIEINPEPVIEVGDVHPFCEDTSKTLEDMLQNLKKQIK